MTKENRIDSVSLAYCSAEPLGALEDILPRDYAFECYVVEQTSPVIGHPKMRLNARCIIDKVGGLQLKLLSMGVNR